MHSNFSDYRLKIDCYIHRLLFVNLTVTTNQKPIVDTFFKKGKEIQAYHQITREGNKRKRNREELQKKK